MSYTPRTDLMVERAPIGLRTNAAFEQSCDLCRQLERELNAANERIETLNRGNANAERILCELTGCESGRDVPDWIKNKNHELLDLQKAYLELVHTSNERIRRLEEAGDELAGKHLFAVHTYDNAKKHAAEWYKAKEAKP